MHPILMRIGAAAVLATAVILLTWAAGVLVIARRETRPAFLVILLLAACSLLIVLSNFAAAGLIGIGVLRASVEAIDAHRMTEHLYDLPTQATLLARILAAGGCLLGMATGVVTAVVIARQQRNR